MTPPPDAAAQAHIAAQAKLRAIAAYGIATTWTGLPGYDRANVEPFLDRTVPFVLAVQRQSVAITEAYLARKIGRLPSSIDPDQLIGPAIRAGAPPAEVYRRPFVTVWSALKDGSPYEQAVHAGLARAKSAAQTDVQLAMRETLRAVGDADSLILGYARVPDPGACEFCRLVAGQRYRTDQLMPIHNHCGCGVDVITKRNRHEFTGNPLNDLAISRDGVTAQVREHGELGPVLVDATQHFTALAAA